MSKNEWMFADDSKITESPAGGGYLDMVIGSQTISFHYVEIDNMIDALQQARAHYLAQELARTEAKALARWGKERIPA